MTPVAEVEAAIEKLSLTDLGELPERIDDSRMLSASADALFVLNDEEERSDQHGKPPHRSPLPE
jgi:hypothetical protein